MTPGGLGGEVLAAGHASQRGTEVSCQALAVLELLELVGIAPRDARRDVASGEPAGDPLGVGDVERLHLADHRRAPQLG